MDVFILKNNSGTLLNLAELKIFLQPGQEVDLVKRTGKLLYELENNQEVKRAIDNGSLVILKKEDGRQSSSDISVKLDLLLQRMENKPAEVIQQPSDLKSILREIVTEVLEDKMVNGNIVSSGEKRTSIDEATKEMVLKQLIDNSPPLENRMNEVKEKKIDSGQDFSDLIDI